MADNNSKRPPLGVIPKDVWYSKAKTDRLNHLNDAIVRYINASKEIPNEWIEERNQLVGEVGEQVQYVYER